MSASSYIIAGRQYYLRDGLEADNHEIDALAHSGDCFIALATQLGELSHQFKLPVEVHERLEAATRTLLYLQRHYQVTKKASDYRQ